MKQRKKNTSSNNSIKFPIWIVLVGLLSFFVVGFRVCELALNEEIDGIRPNQQHVFNLNGESYVNLFKKHKETTEAK